MIFLEMCSNCEILPRHGKCETSPWSKIMLQTSAQSGNAWPQTTQIDTAPDRRLLP